MYLVIAIAATLVVCLVYLWAFAMCRGIARADAMAEYLLRAHRLRREQEAEAAQGNRVELADIPEARDRDRRRP